MSRDDGLDDLSYEERRRRMQELEEELARERAKLIEIEQRKAWEKGAATPDAPPAPWNNPVAGDNHPPENRSFFPQNGFDDLQVTDSGYSENLLMPDDEPAPGIVDSLPSLTQELSPDTFSSGTGDRNKVWKEDEMKLPERPSMGYITSEDHHIDEPRRTTHSATPEIEEYRREIDDFRDRGYNVSRMFDVFSRDIETVRSSVIQFMQDVNQLKEIEQQLDELDVTGFESDALSLRALLKNPDMVEHARTFLQGLKDRIESNEARERRSRIREVEDLFEETLKEFLDVAYLFEEPIQDIKVSIIDMETTPIGEYRTVKKMIFGLKDAMVREKFVKEKEDEKRSFLDELQRWRKKGFTVSEIESVMQRDLPKAVELYEDFVKKANRLLVLETELDSMNVTGFENEIREIRHIVRKTEKIILVENKMESLKRRVRLSGIQTKMGRLRSPVSGKRKGPSQMTCPKCGGVVPIPSNERPLKVNCSSCQTEFHLKRVPTPAPPGSSSGPEDAGIPVSPMNEDGTASVEVTPISTELQVPAKAGPIQTPPAVQPSCPTCGASLLPDSVFCGLCGHKM